MILLGSRSDFYLPRFGLALDCSTYCTKVTKQSHLFDSCKRQDGYHLCFLILYLGLCVCIF